MLNQMMIYLPQSKEEEEISMIIIINIINVVVPKEVNPDYMNDLLYTFMEDLGPLFAGIILHFVFDVLVSVSVQLGTL